MRNYNEEPTFENLKNSILNDSVGRNEHLYYFIKMLNENPGKISVALNSEWGSGKTFFVKQCQLILDEIKNDNLDSEYIDKISTSNKLKENIFKKKFNTVYYDAWKNDNDIDPLISIISAINEVNNVGSQILGNVLKAVNSFISIVSPKIGIDKEMLDEIKDLVQSKNSIDEQLKKLLDEVSNEESPLVIFIDELDRCRPTFALKVLERIKHYFKHPNTVFVFSINMKELQHMVKREYGQEFDGGGYLDKFFDIFLQLPKPNVETYYEKKELLVEDKYYLRNYLIEISQKLNFQLREQNHYIAMVESILSRTFKNDNIKIGDFYLSKFIIPVLIGIHFFDNEKYISLINGEDESFFIDILESSTKIKEFLYNVKNPNDIGYDKAFDVKDAAKKTYDICFSKENPDGIQITDNLYIDESQVKSLKQKISFLSTWTTF